MALGALEELERRGIRVPESVALLGFDDVQEARHARPPLSTVRQPIRDHARKAFNVVMDQLEGKPTARRILLGSKFIVRKSCGCVSSRGWMVSSAPPPAHASRPNKTLDAWVGGTARALEEFFAEHSETSTLKDRLVDSLSAAARHLTMGPFLELMDRELEGLNDCGDLLMALPVLDSRRRALRAVAAPRAQLDLLDDLMAVAMELPSEAAERLQAQLRHRAQEHINLLLRMNGTLMQTMDLAALAKVLADQLPQLGVAGCFVCLWEGDDVPTQWTRLILACEPGKVRQLPAGGVRFRSTKLLPDEVGRPGCSWLICSTVVPNCYVVLLFGTAEPFVYYGLVDEVGSNFKRLDLLRQLTDLNRRLETMAHTDSLTRLSNRGHLVNQLEAEFRRASLQGLALSCAIMDVDHFKTVNDTYGHAAGDRVLEAVAAQLARNCRSIDHVGRYGGEEFCLVLPRTQLDSAVTLADRMRCAIEQLQFSEDGRTFHVTVSFGLAELGSSDKTAGDIVRRADGALYRAKTSGRNRIECDYFGGE
jgi:diguanylate cyclase (GGDEF)-like protein